MTIRIIVVYLSLLCFAVYSQSQTVSHDNTLRRIHVPILMYHYVGELPTNADVYRRDLTISTRLFRQHLQYFLEHDYTPISLYNLDAALLSGSPLPDKPIILTFDDGYIDHYTNVFPALTDFGFQATFFVLTDFTDEQIGRASCRERVFPVV